jgi:ribose transport system ATP-binding protein
MMGTGMNLLDATGITKRYGGILALNNVHFAARAGEVHAILGENGAGKSTFIQILSGAVPTDEGCVALRGKALWTTGPREALQAGIAAVFQELSLVPDLTVAENIWFRREPLTRWRTIAHREVVRRTAGLLQELGLSDIPIDRPVRLLSIAERQLAEIAKALSTDPDILILDEATSALPPREVAWLLNIARQRAADGKLVLYISHRMAEVRQVADRITIFRNGETVGSRETADLSDDQIVTMMLGRKLERLYPERTCTRTEKVALSIEQFYAGNRLHGINLNLHGGEILGVAGLQGHGQRELFLALFGVIAARGRITIWGRPARIRDPRHALSSDIGMALLPEDRRNQGLLLTKSVRENLILTILPKIARHGFLDLRAERARVREAVQRLYIKAATSEQQVGTLSGGNQQKVVLAKLLMTGARILLFYDPTRGVDVGTKAEIFRLMRHLAYQGYAILFYSTDLPELVHLADRVAVFSYGRIADVLEGDALTEQGILRATLVDRRAA